MAGQILRGRTENAEYKTDRLISMYRHNPLIEALPAINTLDDIISEIKYHPQYSKEDRELPTEVRLHAVQTLSDFIEPTTNQVDTEFRFSRMIRHGYVSRNPIDAKWKQQLRMGFPEGGLAALETEYKPVLRSTAAGFAMIGVSGVGKTTALETTLLLYPQVIEHARYDDKPFPFSQIVWIKLDCPSDGSLKGLCLNYLQAYDRLLNTNYRKQFRNYTVDQLVPEMGLLAFSHGLGVIVIDEIQRLSSAKSGGAQRMLDFFVELINTIGVPVVLCGTFSAMNLLSENFASARRVEGQGDMFWWNYAKDEEWDEFIRTLWTFQWTKSETPLTEKLSQVMYDESQGIPDIAVKLYMFAQWSAMVTQTKEEKITVSLLRQVAKDNLRLSRKFLDALKSKNPDLLSKFKDLSPARDDVENYMKKAIEEVRASGIQNTLHNQQVAWKTNTAEPTPYMRITQWLVNGGIESKLAKGVAKKTLNLLGEEFDMRKAMHYAYTLATNLAEGDGEESADGKMSLDYDIDEAFSLGEEAMGNIINS